MNLIATSELTQYAEVCWDCMPLRVAIISYLVISVIVGVVIGCMVFSGSSSSGDGGEVILVLCVIIGLFWPIYLRSWLRQRGMPDAPDAPPAEKAASPVFAGARGFEVVPLPAVPAIPAVQAVNRDCCPECGKPFAGRKPIRWRDTRVCPDCREYLRVLD